MRWRTCDLWKAGSIIAGVLLLLILMVWLPASAAVAHERAAATPGTATVQATPAEDATVTALNKEQLAQQIAGQQHTLDNWLWSNAAMIVSSVLSTLFVVIGALLGFWQWRVGRNDTQKKESDDQKAAQDKELEDHKAERERRDEEQQCWLKNQEAEREKRAEERFQSAVTGLGDDKEGARIGAAILLRTFLHPGYEQFYVQTFDLAVANLHLPRTPKLPEDADEIPHSPESLDISLPLTTLRQALITAFKEAFPLARGSLKKLPPVAVQTLDAMGIQLDNAYLSEADLKQIWMPQVSLRKANLYGADLSRAELSEANLNKAELSEANLSKADLSRANLSEANLVEANLVEADLYEADLSETTLFGANLSKATLYGADLSKADLRVVKIVRGNPSEYTQIHPIETDFSNHELIKSELDRAYLRGDDLIWTNLSGADLRKARFHDSVLIRADLSGANLSGATLEEALTLVDTNLRGVKGLNEEQKAICKAKGAIIDEVATISSP